MIGLANRTTDVNTAVNATATTIAVDSTADFEDSGFIRNITCKAFCVSIFQL